MVYFAREIFALTDGLGRSNVSLIFLINKGEDILFDS